MSECVQKYRVPDSSSSSQDAGREGWGVSTAPGVSRPGSASKSFALGTLLRTQFQGVKGNTNSQLPTLSQGLISSYA